jgi:hypothetical protein
MTQTCKQCNEELNQESMAQFGDYWVCMSCKPTYVQRFQENAVDESQLAYLKKLKMYIIGLAVALVLIPLSGLLGWILDRMLMSPYFGGGLLGFMLGIIAGTCVSSIVISILAIKGYRLHRAMKGETEDRSEV